MHTPSPSADLDALAALLRGRRFTVLTGAGISTESGIPDYRSPRPGPRPAPMQHDTFVRDADARRRYWARSAAGYPRVASAKPNAAHRALAELEDAGLVTGIITQNVDGLHQRAGSRRVVELHGALCRVRCLACGDVVSRDDVQDRLARLNPAHPLDAAIRPDGDAALADALVERFEVPGCACGGVWMPDVVFFGGSVPRPTVADAWALYEDGDALLVVGSSLAVYSGFRFVVRAAKEGHPTGLLTLGPTRADDRVDVKVSAPLGTALPRLAAMLTEAA